MTGVDAMRDAMRDAIHWNTTRRNQAPLGAPRKDETMPRDDYQERVDTRRERFERGADRAARESSALLNSAHTEAGCIPLGQPILVGHHSERRHRNALKRIDDRTRKGIKRANDAKRLRNRAAAVGRAGISSDDPDAIEKLRAKLTRLKASRALSKRGNAAWKAAQKRPDVLDDGGKYGDLPASMRDLLRTWEPPYSFVRRPFDLTGSGAECRRLAKRIAELEEAAAAPERADVTGITADGVSWRVFENRDINRVCIEFEARISREHCAELRRFGFKWNRTEECWTRLLSGDAWAYGIRAAHEGRCAQEGCHVQASRTMPGGLPDCGNHTPAIGGA